jgi:hypothetical protein
MQRWVALAILLCGLSVSGAAGAEVILDLRDPIGDPYSQPVVPGNSVSVDVYLQVTEAEQVIGLGFWLSEPSNAWSGGNGVALTGRSIPFDSPFDDVTTADSILLSSPGNRLDPLEDRDVGAITDGTPYDPSSDPAVVMVLTLTISVDLAPGSYTIVFSDSPQGVGLEWVDSAYDPRSFDSVGSGYVIQVTPEPGTGALLGLGVAGLAARRGARPRH